MNIIKIKNELIKQKESKFKGNIYHYRNTSDEENPRYNVGGFKVVPNIIGIVNVINTI